VRIGPQHVQARTDHVLGLPRIADNNDRRPAIRFSTRLLVTSPPSQGGGRGVGSLCDTALHASERSTTPVPSISFPLSPGSSLDHGLVSRTKRDYSGAATVRERFSFNPEPAARPAPFDSARFTAFGRDTTPCITHRRDREL
jgi:hypothetical protein